jgi:uncharacterized protein
MGNAITSRPACGAGPALTPSPKAAMLRPLLLALSALAFAAVALASGASLAAPTFPPLTGRVVDEAQILSPESTAEIAAKLNALEAKSSDQLVVFIAKSLQGYAIEDYGYQLGRAWGIGQKGLDNGVLLIAVPSERKVRIEVGRGLEPQLTDALSTLIIENTILPPLREGRFADGITKGVQDIASVLLGDAEAVRQRAEAFAAQSRPLTSSEIIALFVVGGLILFFFYRFYMNWRKVRSGYSRCTSRKALAAGRVSAGGWLGALGDFFRALGLTLVDAFGGSSSNSSSKSGGGGSSGSSSGGGGGDFGGGGASGNY